MAYEIIFFYDNRVAVLNTTSNKLLPMIYNSLNEFILYTVLNENELIVDFSIYDMIQYEYEERKFSDEASKQKFEEETCLKYDCKEISIRKIKDALPSLGATIEYDYPILKKFN